MTAASQKQSNLYMKKGRRGAQTSHSNSTDFLAPDLYSASAIHLPFPRASPLHPDRMTEETVRSHHGREVFLTSSVGQPQNSRGGTRKPVGWQAGCAECALLRLSGITGLMPSGREAPCTWKPLSRPIGSPRRFLCPPPTRP